MRRKSIFLRNTYYYSVMDVWIGPFEVRLYDLLHSRRIKTEEKAKVVAVLGGRYCTFLNAALTI